MSSQTSFILDKTVIELTWLRAIYCLTKSVHTVTSLIIAEQVSVPLWQIDRHNSESDLAKILEFRNMSEFFKYNQLVCFNVGIYPTMKSSIFNQ